jgi:HAD superfamily phosphatase (TIGR01668 family)
MKCIPTWCCKNIFSIDTDVLKENNIKYILTDLDNTLAPFNIPLPTIAVKELINEFKEQGFTVIIVSNNTAKRVELFAENLNVDLIIYGHSHKREVKEIDNILYINPGSVGPRRFKLPITMIKLHLFDNNINEENIELIELID